MLGIKITLSTFLELIELGHVQPTAERPWESTPRPAFLRCMGLLRSGFVAWHGKGEECTLNFSVSDLCPSACRSIWLTFPILPQGASWK